MGRGTAYEPVKGEEDGGEAKVSRTPRWSRIVGGEEHIHQAKAWLRPAFEAMLILVILFLTLKLALANNAPVGGRPRGPNDPKKDFGFADKVFMNESKYANEGAFLYKHKLDETLRHWVSLSSKGRGYVEVPVEERDTLDGPPYLMNPLMRPYKKELYMISGFHQLHCLSTIMASYARLRFGEDESDMGFHIAHCFDYLREGIICAGDATLEGNNTARYPGIEIPWGTTHRCANWDALIEWADERTVFPFPPGLDTGI